MLNPYSSYNPYNSQQITAQQPQTSPFIACNSIAEAQNYPLQPNQTVYLMDSNEPIFYVKSSNGMGQSSLRTFRFEEMKPKEQSFVTTDDFEKMINELKGMIANGKPSVQSDEPSGESKSNVE